MKRLLIVGHLNLDHIVTQETEARECPGGGALYTAFAASIYANPVDLLAVRCTDMPNEIFQTMDRCGIDTRQVLPTLGCQRRSSMAYTKDLVRTNYAHKTAAWLQATIEQTPRHYPANADTYALVYLAPFLAGNQGLYASWARSNGLRTAMDLSEYFANENTEAVLRCLSKLDIFMPSDIELAEIFPDIAGDLQRMVERVGAYGVRLLIVKRSTKGSLLCDLERRRFYAVGIRQVDHVADATGAGDSFNGGFLSCYLATGDPLLSARYASVVASCCIQSLSYFGMLEKRRDALLALAQDVSYREISLEEINGL